MRRRFLTAAVVATALLAGVSAAGGPASASLPSHHGPRCFAGDVTGLAILDARLNLADFGCAPGRARDGHHYVVRTECGSIRYWGVVVRQRPTGVVLRKDQRLVVFVGVAGQAAGCRPVGDPVSDPASITEPFDGAYLGSFTTTNAPPGSSPAGSVFPGLSFSVAYGVISGDMTGTLSGLGVSTDARLSIDGRTCVPVTEVRFVASASYAAVASGDMTCSGEPALTGVLTAPKQ